MGILLTAHKGFINGGLRVVRGFGAKGWTGKFAYREAPGPSQRPCFAGLPRQDVQMRYHSASRSHMTLSMHED